jgi:hypothetical protein
MEINQILNKVITLLSNTAVFNCDFKTLNIPNYDDVVNLWNYHITTNKIYRRKYIRPEYNKNVLKQIINYKQYYTPSIQTVFENHTVLEQDNILLFFIKNQKKLLIFLKDTSNKSQPFIKLYLPFSKIKNIDSKMLDIDDNIIRMLVYK